MDLVHASIEPILDTRERDAAIDLIYVESGQESLLAFVARAESRRVHAAAIRPCRHHDVDLPLVPGGALHGERLAVCLTALEKVPMVVVRIEVLDLDRRVLRTEAGHGDGIGGLGGIDLAVVDGANTRAEGREGRKGGGGDEERSDAEVHAASEKQRACQAISGENGVDSAFPRGPRAARSGGCRHP